MPLFISLCSNSLCPPCPSSPPLIYRPTQPCLPWAQYQNPQNSSMWSHPQHNLTSVSCTSLSHSPASSSSYCSTVLVLYYTTFSFSLLTCVLASFLNLCLSIASLLMSHVSCSPSPLPFCLYFSLLPNHSPPQYVHIVTYSFEVLGQSLIVVQPHLLCI